MEQSKPKSGKLRGIRLATIMAACLVTLVAGGHFAVVQFGPPTKEEWLAYQARRLRQIEITEESLARVRPWQDLFGTWQYFVGKEGLVPAGAGKWVYVVSHSVHDNETPTYSRLLGRCIFWIRKLWGCVPGSRPYRIPVGDAVLAVDCTGKFHTMSGHVCGGVILGSVKKPESLDDFLATTGLAKDSSWQEYNPHNQ